MNREREILTEILHHLMEVEDRVLHLAEGYGSLFEYCIQALGYSEAQAYCRLSAMRVFRELPEIESCLKDGSLNLTHLTQAREYFKTEAKKSETLSKDQKLEVLVSLENKSTRETEKIFAALDPESIPADKERLIRENQDLDSHVHKDPSYAELFERLVDLALKQKEKTVHTQLKVNPKAFSAPKNKKTVMIRDEGSCSFKSPITGKRCGSTFRIQFDHRIPFAKKGEHSVKNIRMLCQNHHLWHAEKYFGKDQSRRYHSAY